MTDTTAPMDDDKELIKSSSYCCQCIVIIFVVAFDEENFRPALTQCGHAVKNDADT